MEEKMIRQTRFTTGEVDVLVWKRTETQEYLTAAQSLKNCEISTIGYAKKRKGTTQVGNITGNAINASRLYEFVDKFNNYYVCVSDDLSFHIFRKSGLVLTFIQTVVTPYNNLELFDIDYAQENDSLVLVHPNHAPGRIYISVYNNPLPPTFAYQALNIYPYPAYDFNNINYNAYPVSYTIAGSVLTFSITGTPGFDNTWVGGQIVGAGASTTSPIGYAIITGVVFAAGVSTFTATIQIPFAATGATVGSQYSIKQPAWSAALGYPSCVIYFQNRLWLGNTQSLNNTVFGSRVNSPINFDVGTGADTDAIVYNLGQTGSGSILWMNGGKQLELYCLNNEFACPQDQNTALTPGTFSVRQQSSYGVSHLCKPITYINDSYYITRSGQSIINFHFNGIGLTYVSSNISAAASHLVKNPINRALLRGSDTSQDNFIYFLNDDFSITAFQFASEYKLSALTPISFQEDVICFDVTSIDNTVCMLKLYNKTGQYVLEQFDDSTRMDGTITTTMTNTGLITGLSAFNGYTAQVVYQGQDFGAYLVAGGSILVSNPHGVSGFVTVGLLYDVEIVPMYPFADIAESAFYKQVKRIYVDYFNTLNFNINGELVPYQNFQQIQAGLPISPQTDTAIVTPFYGWNRFDFNGKPIISITQSSPFDLQITSIGYQIESAVI